MIVLFLGVFPDNRHVFSHEAPAAVLRLAVPERYAIYRTIIEHLILTFVHALVLSVQRLQTSKLPTFTCVGAPQRLAYLAVKAARAGVATRFNAVSPFKLKRFFVIRC